jgi:hypothetical protein
LRLNWLSGAENPAVRLRLRPRTRRFDLIAKAPEFADHSHSALCRDSVFAAGPLPPNESLGAESSRSKLGQTVQESVAQTMG